MTKETLSLRLSCDISNYVYKKSLLRNYGIKYCSDKIYDGDIYDMYLRKLLLESPYNCNIDVEDLEYVCDYR